MSEVSTKISHSLTRCHAHSDNSIVEPEVDVEEAEFQHHSVDMSCLDDTPPTSLTHQHYSLPVIAEEELIPSDSSCHSSEYGGELLSGIDHSSHHHEEYIMSEHHQQLLQHHEVAQPYEAELIFHGLSQQIGVRTILDDISGHATSGQVLAVMGPSGSGKTSLLNTLSGRRRADSGVVTLNGKPMCKQLRRQICYVLQDDVFFPSLTLRQTLMYTARLRLPESMRYSEKVACVDKLIEDLQLTECQHTVIGNHSLRGLSGGEKKRANIACELLTNPSVMLIDEPTSGLDSCTAHSLVQIIKQYAVKKRKTIVMTVHQPSSQMFYMFDQLLLLSSGRLSYFGPVAHVVPFFNQIGLPISMHYNPADFILEKVKSRDSLDKIVDAAKRLPKLPKIYLEHHEDITSNILKNSGVDAWKKESLKSIELEMHSDEHSSQQHSPVHHHSHHHHHHHHDTDSGRSSWSEPDRSSTFSSHSNLRHHDEPEKQSASHHDHIKSSLKSHPKWPTSRWTQILVLTDRNFREAQPRMLSKMNWIQTIILALIAGMIWFQPSRTEERIDDIRGWMFFTTNYWMLFGLFQAMTTFPAEREVINKERASGAYRLSSYYIAKMIGELPLTVALPSVYFLISYPMMGITSSYAFFACWFFLVASTICAQSVGLFIGAACCDFEVAITFAALYSLATTLFAGFYTAIAPWLSWTRFFSMIYYAFLNMQLVEFRSAPILCAQQSSRFEFCEQNRNASSAATAQQLYVPFDDLKTTFDPMNSEPLSIWANTAILVVYLFLYRALGYLVLRFGRRAR